MIELIDLAFNYPGYPPVLRGLSLSMEPGRIWALLGPNGAGKTTLLRLILGLVKPAKGRVLVFGEDSFRLPSRERALKTAYVPQQWSGAPPMTVFETALLGRRPHITWSPRPVDVEIAWDTLRLLDLDSLADRPMSSLSGGQKQKVMLARALAQRAPWLILDEPTGNLDLRHQVDVLEKLSAAATESGVGVILSLHDINMAAHYVDEVVLLDGAKGHQCGKPEEVLTEANLSGAYGLAMGRIGRAAHFDGFWFPKLGPRRRPLSDFSESRPISSELA